MANEYDYIKTTGLIIANTSEILAGVQQEYKNAFGEDIVVTADSPQGVLITAEALARDKVVNNNAALANQINPNTAGGPFQDAICALTGIQRKPATKTVVEGVELTGIPGTLIPAGSQAQTTIGDLFELQSGVVLDGSGDATGTFASVEFGAVPCTIGDLNQVVTGITGWETVNNPNVGALGQDTQSDVSLRAFRLNTLAYQGTALPVAIISALYYVEGVQSLAFLENYNDVPVGALIRVTNGATLSNTTWGMTTAGTITIGTSAINFALSGQALPSPNPWPVAKYTTTANVALTGLGTQAGGDWSGAMTAADIVLVKNNTSAIENGLYSVASGAWSRVAGYTDTTVILGSISDISMIKNSIYVSIKGGSDLDVAAALLENKSLGAGWNGNTTVNIVEPISQQSYPVKFTRAASVPVSIRVTISAGDPTDIVNAIMAYVNGEIDGETGFVVGSDVSPFEIAGAVGKLLPGTFMTKVEVSYDSPLSFSTNTLPIRVDQIATTQISAIEVLNA